MENLEPGPSDKSVLYDQDRHISERVWNGIEGGPLRCIPTPNSSSWEINDRMWDLIRQTGLEQLARMKKIELDHGLITGLVERWRPETNTFHFNSGEATVTLEDVAYIYGLPIDGIPVNGRTFSLPSTMTKVCEELLGLVPDMNFDCYGVQIKFTWLRENFGQMPNNRPRDQDVRRTRAFLFCLVAGQIFWTSSGTKAPAHILELFRRFEKRSWGSACLANLYRGLAKVSICQKKGKAVKTITGPLKLLQVWAYSRIRIGRPIRPRADWNTDVEFPLVLTWYTRLQFHHFQTKLEEARRDLDNMDVDAFNWQPYRDYENLEDYIDEADVPLFQSNTVLICFWIVERHCPERVMKQFGLQQIVPPRFLKPFPRNEVVPTGDHRREKKRAIWFGVWNKRIDAITYGEEGDAGPHNDAYLKWYRSITRLRIGRPISGNSLENHNARRKIMEFTERLLASCDDADKLEVKTITDFCRFIDGVRAKANQLKDECSADFKTTQIEVADIAQFDEAYVKSSKGAHAEEDPVESPKGSKRPFKTADDPPHQDNPTSPVASPPKKRSKRLMGKSSEQAGVSKPASPEILVKSIGVSSPTSPSIRRSPRIGLSQKSTMSPIKVRDSNGAKCSNIPFTSSPWSAQRSCSTPSPGLAKLGTGESPFSEISSMILNVKARFREPKPPLWMADYNIGAWMRNPQYKLTAEELDILTIFRNEYADMEGYSPTIRRPFSHVFVFLIWDLPPFMLSTSRKAKLGDFCTPVTATIMKDLLKGAWMDNWTMHSWFEILKTQAPSAYFFECALSDWYVNFQTSEKLIQNSFSQALLDNVADKELLFFPVWNNHHFFLLVGRVQGRRWEYYNSMQRDGDYKFAESYLTWINDRFMQYGWNDPNGWTKHRMECPMQTNYVDCGIFVMAYAQHIALGKAMGFKQSDMYYYRAKIVSDIYRYQFERWETKRQMESSVGRQRGKWSR